MTVCLGLRPAAFGSISGVGFSKGCASCPTQLAATRTYGTLETILDASTETQEKWTMPQRPRAWNNGTTHVDTSVRRLWP
jgi:hypothetical protein